MEKPIGSASTRAVLKATAVCSASVRFARMVRHNLFSLERIQIVAHKVYVGKMQLRPIHCPPSTLLVLCSASFSQYREWRAAMTPSAVSERQSNPSRADSSHDNKPQRTAPAVSPRAVSAASVPALRDSEGLHHVCKLDRSALDGAACSTTAEGVLVSFQLITQYLWDEDERSVSITVPLKGVGSLPREFVTW